MTDRIHSCKQSPNGRHEPHDTIPPICRHCRVLLPRRNVPAECGWNVPKQDPDAHLGVVGTE